MTETGFSRRSHISFGRRLLPSKLPINSNTEYEGGNLGHRIHTKGGYFPVPPLDSSAHCRLTGVRLVEPISDLQGTYRFWCYAKHTGLICGTLE
jgi:hypothetical protein